MSAVRVALFLLPFVVSIAVSLLMAAYGLRRGETSGARPFAVAMVFQALWVIGYALELAAGTIAAKLVLDDLQWLFSFGWASFILAFITAYTGRDWQKTRWFWAVVTAAPIAFLGLLVTNRLHGLVRTRASIVDAQPLSMLEYPISPAMLSVSIYLAALYLVAVLLLGTHALRQHRLFRNQSLIILAGTLVPTVGGMLSMVDVRLGPYRDISPFTFTVSALVIGFGLLRYKLLTLGPVAREAIFRSMADPVLVLDPMRRIVDANAQAEDLFRTAGIDLIGAPAERIVGPYPGLLERIDAGDPGEWTCLDDRSGAKRHFDVSVRDIRPAGNVSYGTLVMLHELTEIHEARAELFQAREELARRERFSAVGKLLSKVAHDLRNPMGTLRASLHTVREAADVGDGELQQRAVARADAMVGHLETMTAELLDFGAQASGHPTDLALETWLQRLVAEYEAPEGVSFLTAVEPGLFVRADPLGLRRALMNLLSNAADATTAGERGDGRVRLTARRDGSEVRLTVSDTGVGIPQENLGMVFEPLYTTKPDGRGLGMSIVRDVADSHRGRLEVDSAPGRGTSVSLILPAGEPGVPS